LSLEAYFFMALMVIRWFSRYSEMQRRKSERKMGTFSEACLLTQAASDREKVP
jgi:hypothetical protein